MMLDAGVVGTLAGVSLLNSHHRITTQSNASILNIQKAVGRVN